MHNDFEPAKHHCLLISKLEAVARGEIDRLAVFMPPGSAKSTYVSMLFPCWLMATTGKLVLAASHTTTLAERFGRKVRRLVMENEEVLGVHLSAESQAVGRWEMSNGAEYYAAGAGTGISGFRADCAIIDDPIRGREDADSPVIRDKIWDWYKSDVVPRLRPGGSVILVQTRWHEDDLAGRLLADEALGRGSWHVVSLPARAGPNDPIGRKPGEYLWDDDYGYGDVLRREEKEQGARNWSAQYQQSPAPESGAFFLDDWMHPYVHAPPRNTLIIYGASDYAVSEETGADHTVHVVVGMDPEDRMWLLDLWRGQESSDVWIEAFCDLVKQWQPIGWAEETGQINLAVGPALVKRMRERRTFVARKQFASRTRKEIRAQSIRGRMAVSGLMVPVNMSWWPALRSELLSFPVGKHDDQADALGLIGQIADLMQKGRIPEIPPTPKIISTEPGKTTVTLGDMFEANERVRKKSGRI